MCHQSVNNTTFCRHMGLSSSKCTKTSGFSRDSAPDPAGAAYDASPSLVSWGMGILAISLLLEAFVSL